MALKLGLNLGYWGIGPQGEEAVEVVQAAESHGFESVWVAESYGSDVVSVLAWLAAQTETIKLGAAIMQVPARPPAAAAMAGATIDKLSGGRFIFGFGPSGPQVSEGWYGVPYAKPWGRTREYIEVVREIIAREGPLEHQGEHYQLPLEGGGEGKALKLNFHPLRNEIPVFVGAIGRKSVEMAAEICDGWIPIFFSADAFEETWGEHLEAGLREGRPAALRPRDQPLDAGRDRRRPRGRAERRQGRAAPLLRRHGQPQDELLRRPRPPLRLRRGGADEVQSLFHDGKRDEAFEAIPDELVDATSLVGTEAEVAERVERFAAAGIDRLIFSPVHVDAGQRIHTLERLAAIVGARCVGLKPPSPPRSPGA